MKSPPPDIERARSALSRLSPDCNRDTWVRLAMSLKNGFGDAGFEIWDDWSSCSEKYRASDAKATWKSIKSDGKVTIATLYHEAKQAGWKDDTKYKKPTKAEIDARNAKAAVREKQLAAEEAAEREAAAKWAQRLWDAATPCVTHPYLERKGVAAHGLRVGNWERVNRETGEVSTTPNALLVPIVDRKRKLWSLQAIFPSKQSNGRDKDYLAGGAKSGKFHAIGKPQQRDGRHVFVLAEGYATGASVHAATGHMVLVCFDMSGLMPVARSLRERAPDAWIVIAADNDTHTDGNPGLTAARKVAKEVGGLVAVPPPGDFNDLQVTDGQEAVKACIEAAVIEQALKLPSPVFTEPHLGHPVLAHDEVDDEKADSYFRILGFGNDKYYFYHRPKRQVLERSRHDFTESGLLELAPTQWWEANNFGRPKGGIDKLAAADWIYAVANKRGFLDIDNCLRGRGAWRDKGRSVFHHGDHLTVDGVRMDLMQIDKTNFIYESKTPLPALGIPATCQQGENLFATAQMMRWVNPASAMFLCGWVFLAQICGALKWRPHIWVTGEAGGGKSAILNDFVGRLLGPMRLHLDAGDSSAPGIRQKLKRDALPVVLDEAEAQDDKGRDRMRGILTLARGASTDSDALIAKGTVSGQALEFSVRSMFLLGAIGALAQNKESDNSRFATLAVRNRSDNSAPDRWAQLKPALAEIERDESLSARLLSRAILMLKTLHRCIDVFAAAAANRLGSERYGDQYGTLLAGWWCLTHDQVITDTEAQSIVDGIRWDDHSVGTRQAAPDAAKCLDTILDQLVMEKGSTTSIRALVALADGQLLEGYGDIDAPTARRILQDRGITITKYKGERYVAIIRHSSAVSQILRNTEFALDWQTRLSRIDGYVPLPSTSCGPKGKDRSHGFPLSSIRLPNDSSWLPADDDERPI